MSVDVLAQVLRTIALAAAVGYFANAVWHLPDMVLADTRVRLRMLSTGFGVLIAGAAALDGIAHQPPASVYTVLLPAYTITAVISTFMPPGRPWRPHRPPEGT